MGRIVGIDLGTTNSLVAYLGPQTTQPKCIPGPYGSTLCPSVVSLDADGTIVVGEAARRRLLTQPERTIYSVKRLMGRGPADIQDELKLFPFRIDPSSKNVRSEETRLNSSHVSTSYAVFCSKKKTARRSAGRRRGKRRA